MAYALKNTGLATEVAFCILVDEDGETIVDLAATTQTLIRHQSVTIGQKAWKGTQRKYFETFGSGINAYGITWPSTSRPVFPTDKIAGACVFVAYAGMSEGTSSTSANNVDVNIGNNSTAYFSGITYAAGGVGFRQGLSSHAVGDTNVPKNGTTSFSAGANWRIGATHADASSQPYFGLETGSLSADGADAKPGNYGLFDAALHHIGGRNTYGAQPAKRHVVVGFRRKLTLAEVQSLHNDWFGVLIQQAGSVPAAPTGASMTGVSGFSATLNWTDNASTETSYQVEYRNVTNAGSFVAISGSPFAANTTSATKNDFTPAGHTFQMRVRAVGTGGASAYLTGPTFVIPGSGGSPTIEVTPATGTVEAGGESVLTITRSAAATSAVTYNLSSSATGVATVPATVQMLAGLSEVSFPVSAVAIGSATITATNAADSSETDTASVTVAAAKKILLLAHIDALGATAVKGDVHLAPASSELVGEYVGRFEGAVFGSVAESGQAPLRVRVDALTDVALTLAVDDDLVCVWEGVTASGSALGNAVAVGSVGPHECVVIEE